MLVLTVVSIVISGVAFAAPVPKVQFFGSFTSYQQSEVQNAQGLVANAAGNLYVSGTTLLGYVPVDANGNPIIASQQSIASESSSDVMGLAIDAANNLYRVDPAGGTVQKYTYGGSPTSFTYVNIGSGWSQPSSVAVDSSSNVYVLDAGPGTIVKLTPGGGSYTQTTLYTNALLKSTTGLSIDQYGNFYVASGPSYGVYSLSGTATPAVYKLTPGGGTYTLTTIGSGWASPSATAVDSNLNVWVADYGAGTINLLVPNGSSYTQSVYQSIGTLRTLMVNQTGKLYGLAYGTGSAVIWAGGTAPHNLGTYNVGTSAPTVTLTINFLQDETVGAFTVTTQGIANRDFTTTGGTCAAGSYTSGQSCTLTLAFTPQAPGKRTGAVVLTDGSGAAIGTNYLYGTGVGPQAAIYPGTQTTIDNTTIDTPNAVVADAANNLYVVAQGNRQLVKYTLTGGSYTKSVVTSWPGEQYVQGLAIDGAGNFYWSSVLGGTVYKETPNGSGGTTRSLVAGGFSQPDGVAVDALGNVYICDQLNGQIVEESPDGIGGYTRSVPLTGFTNPYQVAVDLSGDIYVLPYATGNGPTVKETPNGSGGYTATTVSSNGGTGLAVDANGTVYIASGNVTVYRYTPNGGSYTATQINGNWGHPWGIGFDNLGNFYIADAGHYSLSKFDVAGQHSLSFAATAQGSQSSDSPQSLTLLNGGNAALTFPLPSGSGAYNPSVSTNFAWDSASTCTQTGSSSSTAFSLTAGTSCTIAADFIPTAAGSISGSIVLTDNNLNATGATQTISLSGTGSASVTQLAFTTSPATSVTAGGNAGSSITVVEENSSASIATSAADTITLTVTGPNGYSQTYTATAVAGVATFNLGSPALTKVGGYTYTASVTATPSIATAVANETVTAATAATVTASTGSGQSAIIGAAFATALQVTVTDSYGNAVSGATVSFSGPGTGAGATFTTSPATTNASGVASVTAKANATVGSYNATAAVSGATSGTFALTNTQATPAVTLTPLPASPIVYGQAATSLSSTVSYTVGTPGGTVTFKDGSTALGAGTLSSGATALPTPGYLQVGTHSLTANYGGDANYVAAASTASSYVVNQAAVTIAASSSQTAPALSPSSTLAVTLAGTYAGTGILVPGSGGSSTVTCNFYNNGTLVASSTATVVAGTASSSAACPVPSTVTGTQGTYTATATFNGDTNYAASNSSTGGGSGASLNFPFTVQPVAPAITWAPASSATNVVYGTSVSSALTAAASYNSSTVAGSYAYTTTVNGSTVTLTGATVLPAGSYTLTVKFTPTSSNYTTATKTLTYVVTQATPGIGLASNATPVWIGATVTYTATVTGASGGVLPSGAVTFYDGSTALGTSSLNSSGVATVAAVPATSGTHSIKAVLAADTNYVTVTSGAVAEVAVDFTVATSGSSTASVLPGTAGAYSIVVTPVGNTTFPGSIAMSVSGLPAGATATFSTTPIASGSSATTETLTITTSATTLVLNRVEKLGSKLAPLSLALLFLPLAGFRRARKLWMRSLMLLVLLVGGLAATAGLSGCSLPSGYFGQTPKTFTVTVTGNNGSFTRTTSVTLTVE